MSLWRTHRAVLAPAGLAAAIALCVYAASARRPAPSASPAVAGAEAGDGEAALRARLERASLEHKLSSLESEVASLRRGAEGGEGSADEAASPQAAEAALSSAPLDEAERQRRRDQEEAKVFAHIGERFSAQPVDPGWAAEMTKRVDDHLRARPAGDFQMEHLECRSSACRLELSVRSDAELGNLRDDLRHGLGDVMGTGASKRDDDGHFVLYFAKDPQALGL